MRPGYAILMLIFVCCDLACQILYFYAFFQFQNPASSITITVFNFSFHVQCLLNWELFAMSMTLDVIVRLVQPVLIPNVSVWLRWWLLNVGV
jgi:hypothetical protein